MTQISTLEEKIASLCPQPSSEFASQLQQQAVWLFSESHQADYRRRMNTRHYIYTVVASALLTLATIFTFTPPGQVLAQKIFRFGWFVFINEPTKMEHLITATPLDAVSLQSNHLDLQTATDLVGFPVYTLSHIPEGYQLLARDPQTPLDIVYNQAGQVMDIHTMYWDPQSELKLSFTQIHLPADTELDAFPFPVGDAEPQFVQVGKAEGVWLENFIWGAKPDVSGELQTVPYNLLIWQVKTKHAQTFQFWLGSEEQLSLDVMLRMAESIEIWEESNTGSPEGFGPGR